MQAELLIDDLPDEPLAAARHFHGYWTEPIAQALATGCEALVLQLPPAGHEHRDWRRAAVKSLARAHAPQRVNMVAADNAEALAAISAYLADAPGVTGQYLPAAPAEGA